MKYADHLKSIFPGVKLQPDDLFLLESFQISYLPDRLPKKELAIFLHVKPSIESFLIQKQPAIKEYIENILNVFPPASDLEFIDSISQELIWEIGEMIIYNKYPEIYDEKIELKWDREDIESITPLKDKTVIDSGAGTGRLSFMVAPHARTVFAVEPVTKMRCYIRDKSIKRGIKNLHVLDGFLHAIPLPDHSADLLVTSNAIGWDLEAELKEIERVVKKGGFAIHLIQSFDPDETNPFHDKLTSSENSYSWRVDKGGYGVRWKYFRSF